MDNFLFLPRAVASAAYDLAFAAAVGLVLSRIWLRPVAGSTTYRKLSLSFMICASVLFLTLGTEVILTTAMMTGTLSGVTSQIKDVLLSTHAGRLLLPALLFCVVLIALAAVQPRLTIAPVTILFGMAIARAATGHAASQGDFTLLEAMQLLHLSSTAVWAGSVMIAGFFVVPPLTRSNDMINLVRFAKRLSTAATIAVGLVILSGIYNAWLGLAGTLPPLIHTQWGILLTIKSSLVTIAILLGLYNRILLQRAASTLTIRRFERTLRVEAVLIATILSLSAFLANSPPVVS